MPRRLEDGGAEQPKLERTGGGGKGSTWSDARVSECNAYEINVLNLVCDLN